MKNSSLILSVIALVAVVLLGILVLTTGNGKADSSEPASEGRETVAQKGDIVYFNLDRVLDEYDMANELRSAVESKVQSANEEVNRRGNSLQKKVNDFQDKINKGLITRSVAEVQSNNLQKEQDEFNNYAALKQQELQEEQAVMMNQIANAIKEYVDKYNTSRQFSLILATQGDILPAPVVVGDIALDITDDIIKGLNDEYVKEKAGQK